MPIWDKTSLSMIDDIRQKMLNTVHNDFKNNFIQHITKENWLEFLNILGVLNFRDENEKGFIQ